MNTIPMHTITRALSALNVAESTLSSISGQVNAWASVMGARIELEYAIKDLAPVAIDTKESVL